MNIAKVLRSSLPLAKHSLPFRKLCEILKLCAWWGIEITPEAHQMELIEVVLWIKTLVQQVLASNDQTIPSPKHVVVKLYAKGNQLFDDLNIHG